MGFFAKLFLAAALALTFTVTSIGDFLGGIYYSVVDGTALESRPELSSNPLFQAVKASGDRYPEMQAQVLDVTAAVAPLFADKSPDEVMTAIREMADARPGSGNVSPDIAAMRAELDAGREIVIGYDRRTLAFFFGKDSPFRSADSLGIGFKLDKGAHRYLVTWAGVVNRTTYL